MRLSEAIRIGAMNKPQAFGDTEGEAVGRRFTAQLFGSRLDVEEKVPATCALGAAFEAVQAPRMTEVSTGGGLPFRGESSGEGVLVTTIYSPWSSFLTYHAECPNCGRTEPLARLIPHLNDDHKMTREAIAKFVEAVEDGAIARGLPIERAVQFPPAEQKASA